MGLAPSLFTPFDTSCAHTHVVGIKVYQSFLWKRFSSRRQPAQNVNQVEKIEITKFCSRSFFGIPFRVFSLLFLCHNKIYKHQSIFKNLWALWCGRVSSFYFFLLCETFELMSRINGLPERHLNFLSFLTPFPLCFIYEARFRRSACKTSSSSCFFQKSLRHHSHWLEICLHACFPFPFSPAIFPFYVA